MLHFFKKNYSLQEVAKIEQRYPCTCHLASPNCSVYYSAVISTRRSVWERHRVLSIFTHVWIPMTPGTGHPVKKTHNHPAPGGLLGDHSSVAHGCQIMAWLSFYSTVALRATRAVGTSAVRSL